MKPRVPVWHRNSPSVATRMFTLSSLVLRLGKRRDCRWNRNNSMTTDKASEVLAAWEVSSQYWNKHQALIEQMYAPLSQALIEEAQIVSGQAVLDVGGGSGEPSLTIAPVVGSSGSVTYTDPPAGMVKAARAAADRQGIANIQLHQCSAEQLPF